MVITLIIKIVSWLLAERRVLRVFWASNSYELSLELVYCVYSRRLIASLCWHLACELMAPACSTFDLEPRTNLEAGASM